MSAQQIVISKKDYEEGMLLVADRVREMIETSLPQPEDPEDETVETISEFIEEKLMVLANENTVNVDEDGNELADDNSVAFPMDEDEDQEVDEAEADCADCDDETDEAGTQ